ncbi:HEAT repeat domain-containing protein [Actinomadura hibisca]|uniref:HEAT repeat domain-containing protein n=1 Tax=Actinomadura hibisca TaxID=68565 RepID=UPI000830FD13|nr:HEAT repeat domain-containing protein [Actinomadura hibisca]
MLDGLDEIDWTAYQGAYGAAEEVPDILRAMASDDLEVADEGLDEFFSSVWHQGTVYTVTVVAVPFVVRLAADPRTHRREILLQALGDLCDPERSDGREQPAVAAAVTGHRDTLVALLDDPDPEVREYAAYAVARCGPGAAKALTRRWSVEEVPDVRASLLMGLALCDAETSAQLARRAMAEPFPMAAAAALALARAGSDLPSECAGPVAAALGADTKWRGPWSADPLSEILESVNGETAAALTDLMAAASPTARIRAAEGMADRFRHSRSAAVGSLPRLSALLEDADPAVVSAAVEAAAHAGAPAAGVAGRLARIARGSDQRAADTALSTLIRLGDPRWQEPVRTAWAAGIDPVPARLLTEYVPPFAPELLDAVRHRLTAQIAAGSTGNPVITLAVLLGAWGPDAAAAVPELTAALEAAPRAVPSALAAIGPAALPAVPALRRVAAQRPETGIRPAHAVWRLTGDTAPLVAAGAALAGSSQSRIARELDLVADAGRDAAPLVPLLARHLTGDAAPTYPERDVQVAAARVIWRAGGETEPVLRTLEAVLLAGDVPVRSAVRLAGDMAPESGADLVPVLRAALSNKWARVGAARALWLHGVPRDELLDPLLAAITAPHGDRDPLPVLMEMRAVEAIPALRDLADRDARLRTLGSYAETVWGDDRIRTDILDTIKYLTSPTPP